MTVKEVRVETPNEWSRKVLLMDTEAMTPSIDSLVDAAEGPKELGSNDPGAGQRKGMPLSRGFG